MAKGNRKAGYLLKNVAPKSVAFASSRDERSAYGLVIEYGAVGVVARQFVSTGATCRALQVTAIEADQELAIVQFVGDGRPVLPGITNGWSSSMQKIISGSYSIRGEARDEN